MRKTSIINASIAPTCPPSREPACQDLDDSMGPVALVWQRGTGYIFRSCQTLNLKHCFHPVCQFASHAVAESYFLVCSWRRSVELCGWWTEPSPHVACPPSTRSRGRTCPCSGPWAASATSCRCAHPYAMNKRGKLVAFAQCRNAGPGQSQGRAWE
jgi:hypothetical protein